MPRIARAQNLRLKYLTPTANKSLSYYTALLESHLFVAYFSLTDFLNLALVSKNIYQWLNFYQHPLFLSYLERTVDDHFSYKNARMVYMFCPESRLRNYRYAGPIGRLNLRANLCVNFPERICVTREALGQIERLASAHHLDANNAVLLPDASPVITEQSMSLLLDQAALDRVNEQEAVDRIVCAANVAHLKLAYSYFGISLFLFSLLEFSSVLIGSLVIENLSLVSDALILARSAYNGTLILSDSPAEIGLYLGDGYCGGAKGVFNVSNCQQVVDLSLKRQVLSSTSFFTLPLLIIAICHAAARLAVFHDVGFNSTILRNICLPKELVNFFFLSNINISALNWLAQINQLNQFRLSYYEAKNYASGDLIVRSFIYMVTCILFTAVSDSIYRRFYNLFIAIPSIIYETCFKLDYDQFANENDSVFVSKWHHCVDEGVFEPLGHIGTNEDLSALCVSSCEVVAGGYLATKAHGIALTCLIVSSLGIVGSLFLVIKSCCSTFITNQTRDKINGLSNLLMQVHTEQREQANQLTLLAADDNNIELGVIPTNVEQPNDEAGDEMVVNIEMAVTAITAIDTQRASIQSPIAFLSAARAGLGRSSNPYAGLMSIDEEKSDEEKSDDEDSDFDLDLELGNASRVRGVLPGANIH